MYVCLEQTHSGRTSDTVSVPNGEEKLYSSSFMVPVILVICVMTWVESETLLSQKRNHTNKHQNGPNVLFCLFCFTKNLQVFLSLHFFSGDSLWAPMLLVDDGKKFNIFNSIVAVGLT